MDKKKLFMIIQAILCIVISVLLAVFSLIIYTKGLSAKTADPTAWIYSRETVGKFLLPVIPIIIITLIMALVGIFLGIRDEKQDIPVKSIEMKKNLTDADIAKKKKRTTMVMRFVILAIAVVLIAIGILNGSARDVLYKAITICTECVGMG